VRKLRLLIAVALAVLAAGSLIAIPLTELIYQERDRIAGEIKALNKECWGRSKTRGPDGTSDISHDPWAGGECWDRMLAIERDLAVQVTDINAELNELGPPRPGEEQTFADRRKEMFKLRKEVFDWMAGLGQKTAYMHLHEKTPCLRNFRRMTNPGRPTRFAPWCWKFGLPLSRKVRADRCENGLAPLSKRPTTREKYPGGAGFIKRERSACGQHGKFHLVTPVANGKNMLMQPFPGDFPRKPQK
jgi:hypothetical protein